MELNNNKITIINDNNSNNIIINNSKCNICNSSNPVVVKKPSKH